MELDPAHRGEDFLIGTPLLWVRFEVFGFVELGSAQDLLLLSLFPGLGISLLYFSALSQSLAIVLVLQRL